MSDFTWVLNILWRRFMVYEYNPQKTDVDLLIILLEISTIVYVLLRKR